MINQHTRGVLIGILLVSLVCGTLSLHVGVISLPSRGHIDPLARVIKEIRARGHVVSAFSTSHVSKFFEPIADQFYSLGSKSEIELAAEVADPENPSPLDIPKLFTAAEKELLGHLLSTFKSLKEQNNLPDVLFVDFLTFAGLDIGDYYDIPVVLAFPGIYQSPFLKNSVLSGTLFSVPLEYRDTYWFRFQSILVSYAEEAMFAMLYYNSNQVRTQYGLPPWKDFHNGLMLNKLTLAFAFYPLVEPAPVEGGMIHFIGAPLKETYPPLDSQLLQWIENDPRDIVYISFGTVSRQDRKLLETILKGCTSCSKYRFLWSLRGDLYSRAEDLFQSLPENSNVYRIAWVAQNSLLEHEKIKVFYTHGGFNSVAEAVHSGTPTLCMPFLGDQPQNCNTLENRGVGLTVAHATLTSESLCPLFDELISNPRYLQSVQVLSEFSKSADKYGVSHGVDIIELAARHGSNTLIPFNASLPWYAYNDRDITLIFFLLYTLVVVLLCYCCCRRKPTNPKISASKKNQ